MRAMLDPMSKRYVFAVLALTLIILGFLVVNNEDAKAPSDVPPSSTSPGSNSEIEGFNKEQFSLSEPGSIWVIVNKKRALPAGHVPEDLTVPNVRLRLNPSEEQMNIRRGVEGDLKLMFDTASKDGVVLVFGSGYRSEATQKTFYGNYVAQSGQKDADTFSARPGYSEHQTGLAFDLTTPDGSCHLQICYGDTPGGQWIQKHAHEYGFVIRYLSGKESVTGYQYEPWHLRYVGVGLATELQKSGQTLEEYFDTGSAAQY